MDMETLLDVLTWVCLTGALIAATLGNRWARLRGYFEGRAALLASMAEARQRGLSAEEWMVGEVERDLAKLPRRWRREFAETVRREQRGE